MLRGIQSMGKLRFGELARLYDFDLEQELDFFDYLRNVFFRTPGAVYYIWEENGKYLSAVRMEPYRDGFILAGLETMPEYRGMGHATSLVRQVLESVGWGRIYSHIHRHNLPSISVHQRCGFQKLSDCAVFVDGSASMDYYTYIYEKAPPE